MKHNLTIRPADKDLQKAIIEDDIVNMIAASLRNQLDYLYETIPNAFAEWNEGNCVEERDNTETLCTKFTLNKDLHSLLEFENAVLLLQTKAFESDLCAPVSEETAGGVHRLTRADFLEMGFTEKQIDDTVRRLSR